MVHVLWREADLKSQGAKKWTDVGNLPATQDRGDVRVQPAAQGHSESMALPHPQSLMMSVALLITEGFVVPGVWWTNIQGHVGIRGMSSCWDHTDQHALYCPPPGGGGTVTSGPKL